MRARRRELASQLLTEGTPQAIVVERVCKEFGANERTVYDDVKYVRRRMQLLYGMRHDQMDVAIAEHIAKAEMHYVRCCKDKQHAAGLATLRWIGELLGITGAQRIAYEKNKMLERLATLKGGEGPDAGVKVQITLQTYNDMRSVYGLPQLSETQYIALTHKALEPHLDLTPPAEATSGNGANGNGHNGHALADVIELAINDDEPDA